MTEVATPYDHVIVGAGTAGCLLANRLSADPSRRVLLLEAGGQDDYLWIHIPVGYLYCIGNPRTDWLFRTEPDAGLNGRQLRYPRGKGLGGCSNINGMIYMRGQARDYDHWAEVCADPSWRWHRCLEAFRQHENHWRSNDPMHGADGEWRVERPRLRWDLLDAFAAAAQQAGIPATTDFNTGDNEGVGYFEVNQRRGVRWTAAKAFLHPVRQRPNLTVWTGAQVRKLLFDQLPDGRLRCAGVELQPAAGRPAIVRAARGVVMAAGAVATPQILLRSGIGARALLQQQGITSLLDLPGVGENLQDHLQIRAVFGV
ncbi:MAG: GMC family oxidoreductase, partial [Rubrivivax sp.]